MNEVNSPPDESAEPDETTRVTIRRVQPLRGTGPLPAPPTPTSFALAAPRKLWPVWALVGVLAAGHVVWSYFYWRQAAQLDARDRDLQAAQTDANIARAAQEDAEQRAKKAEDKARKTELSAKEIWRVATLVNRTGEALGYEILNPKGGWDAFTLDPQAARTHWRLNTEIMVRFNESTGLLRREKTAALRDASTVLGHEPNEDEQNRAKSFSFKLDEDTGNITLGKS
jgi:hypothetical protein